ncbi:TipJ family phage tail tip protein [Pseudomonas wadenswilerensis]
MGASVKRKPGQASVGLQRRVTGHKGGAKKQKQPIVAANGIPSIATARMVYLWSWGPIVGPVNGLRSIKLDGTPIMSEDGTLNYPGVKWQFRSGELNQERLEGVSESSNEIDVQQELTTRAPWLHTVSNAMVDAVRVRLAWPQLQAQDSGGNINGVRIQYAIDVSVNNGAYVEVLASEVNRKNVTKYERSHRVELPAGERRTVRVRRITAEANSSMINDGMLVDAVAEVVDSDQEYPLTAVSCLEYDAQQFGGDIAKIAVLMRGRIIQVPANYDPATRTYAISGPGTSNGIWDGTWKEAWTDCPPWIFRDLALHPYYGLGDRIDASMIDHWSLYRIAQYCDQLVPDGKGGMEPRFTCNLYLQKQAEAWAVLQDLASIFHGLAFWDGNQIVVNADMPQDPVYTYTLSQILNDGAIRYSGSKARDRHSLAMVSWDNPDQGFETDKEPVFDEEAIAEFGVRDMSVEAVGCTSHGQAQRAGQWALATEQLQTREASFRVGLDGHIPRPGQVIALSDPLLAGRANGGRVAAVAGRVITLDRDIEVPVGARLLLNLPSGRTEARQVLSASGRQVTVMADYSEVPEPEAGWALDHDDLKLMQFYVRNVTRPEWHEFQFEVIQHEPSKFDAIEYGTVIDQRPVSVLPPGVQDAPAQVLIGSHVVIDQGIAVNTMTIGWSAAPGAVAYDVEWRWGSRDWVRLPRTGELSVDVRGVYAGQYLARVRAVSALDVASMPATSVLTEVQGKTTPPPALALLQAKSEIFGIRLEWGFPAGATDTAHTEFQMASDSTGQNPVGLGSFAYPTTSYLHSGMAAGVVRYFRARLVDRTGNIGPWSSWVYGQSNADGQEILGYITGKITETQLGQNLLKEIEKISGQGAGSVNNRITAGDTALQGQIAQLQTQITDIAGASVWKSSEKYLRGALVKLDGKMYRAKQDVPAGTLVSNAAYWEYIGAYGSLGEMITALATRVDAVETSVEEIDGQLAAMASRMLGVEAAVSPDMAGASDWRAGDTKARAGAWSLYSAFASGDMALSRRLDTVQASLDIASAKVTQETYARASADEALTQQINSAISKIGENTAAIKSEEQTRINEGKALTQQINSATAKIGENTAAIKSEEQTRINEGKALTQQINSATAKIDENTARIDSEAQAWASANAAMTNTVSQLSSKVGNTQATVEESSRTLVDLAGRVSASTNIKVQVDRNGRYYSAGMGVGVEETPAGMQSQVLFLADRFAVMHQPDGVPKSVFAIDNGQVFMDSALIKTADIINLIITGELKSSDYKAGERGIRINFQTSEFEINSAQGGTGRMNITNQAVTVFDNNRMRVRLGIWG